MTKLTKLLSQPRVFFRDAINNRRTRRSSAITPDEVTAVASGLVPTYVFGFSPWKQFMKGWFPERELFFLPKTIKVDEFDKQWKARILRDPRSEIFIWGFKAERYVMRFAATHGIKVIFVEDGFIRSIALGATKAPPFSLTLDSQTPYFDARTASDLECLLNTYDFDGDPDLLVRADRLMQVLLQSGLSKYNHAAPVDINEIYGPKDRKRVLVVGQVEDDASIECGSARAYSNNDAVMIAALENPDSQIIYKPHPDVMNKHREMRSNPDDVRHLCMVLERDVPLAQAFETVDHVYTITSQAGFEALMRGIHVTTLGCPFYSGWGLTDDRQVNERRGRKLTLQQVFAASYLLYPKYFDPIYKMPLTAEQAVDRLMGLKKLAPPASLLATQTTPAVTPDEVTAVASGLVPTYVFGFSPWKQFMKGWFPERELFFLPKTIKVDEFDKQWKARILRDPRSEIFIWGFKAERYVMRFAATHGIKVIFVEDGFIRSIALGATKAPPFSLTLDSQTPYFDARTASDLECLLNTYDFDGDPDLLVRADRLMQVLLQSGLSKYNHAAPVDINEIYGPKDRKRVLVVGQVEDDASIECGSARAYSNNDAVMIAALENPDSQIIYKPHPDVMNKHREMRSNPDDVRHLCMVLERDVPLAQAFETVDHVYTITSQAGFEALMRGIHVTTLGCPFYSGWGLTDDRQVNERRGRKLTLQQVFAASYLLYPKYFDPIYKMPLTAEQAVDRLMDLKKLAPPASPLAMQTATAVESAQEAAANAPDVRDDLASLRLEIADLRIQVNQGALHNVFTDLCNDMRSLGSEIVSLRSKMGVANAH